MISSIVLIGWLVLFMTINSFYVTCFIFGEEELLDEDMLQREDEYFEETYLTVSPGERFQIPYGQEIEAKPLFESDKIFQKLSLVDKCRSLIADSLLKNNDCQKFFDARDETERKRWQMQFALKVTNCHFSTHQRPEIKCKHQQSNPEWCFKRLDRHYFEIYTQFSLATERICNEMNYDKWQRGVEDLVTELYGAAYVTHDHLKKLDNSSQLIIHKQDMIMEKSSALEDSILQTAEDMHKTLTKQTNDLTSQLLLSQETINTIFKKQAQISQMQNVSLNNIEQSTLSISELIDDQVVTQISSVKNLSTNLGVLLKHNSVTLEQHTGLIYRLTHDIDDAIEKWSPLLNQIAHFLFKLHRFLKKWKFSVYYFGATVTILLFTTFSAFRSVRYPAIAVLLVSFFLEELATNLFGNSAETFFEQLRVSTSTLLFFLFCFHVIQSVVGTNRAENISHTVEVKDLLCDIRSLTNQCATSREISQKELIQLLIDQLVQYRLQAAAAKTELGSLTLRLRLFLETRG